MKAKTITELRALLDGLEDQQVAVQYMAYSVERGALLGGYPTLSDAMRVLNFGRAVGELAHALLGQAAIADLKAQTEREVREAAIKLPRG